MKMFLLACLFSTSLAQAADTTSLKFERNGDQLKVTRTVPGVTTTASYDLNFLRQQKLNIEAQKDRDNLQRDAELAEVNKLIQQAEQLGIPAKAEAPAASQ